MLIDTGAAFNKVLVPNEAVEITQLLCYKDSKQWSLQAINALNYSQVFTCLKVFSTRKPMYSIAFSISCQYFLGNRMRRC